MKPLKKHLYTAVCALALTALILPGQAFASPETAGIQAVKEDFQNPEGMTVDLIYFLEEEDGTETVVEKAERTIIPAGTAAVTVEMQEKQLPRGFRLKDPQDLPLTEETLEVKIQVLPLTEGQPEPDPDTDPEGQPEQEPQEKPEPDSQEKPEGSPDGEPDQKPDGKPDQKPDLKPDQKPDGKPDGKPDQKPDGKPDQKPDAKPDQKPDGKPDQKPDQKPAKPSKPAGKPDFTNPQTGDSFSPALWLALGTGSACALLVVLTRKKIF